MTVRVADIAFVRFEAPDLDVMESFLTEFGLQRSARDDRTLYMRGTDDEGLRPRHPPRRHATVRRSGVRRREAHRPRSTFRLDGFSPVHDLAGPGGGKVVQTIDSDGFQVEFVAVRGSVGRLPMPVPSPRNNARTTERAGSPLRLGAGPAHVKRLGHCVIDVTDFRASEAWYKEHFGLVTSDEIALDESTALGAFLRCDRGDRYVDHHTLFLVGLGRSQFNHATFEAADFDDLMRGNSHLAAAGQTHQWGIGRHILGSQIYDYWLDPYGHMGRTLDRRRPVRQRHPTQQRQPRHAARLAMGTHVRSPPGLTADARGSWPNENDAGAQCCSICNVWYLRRRQCIASCGHAVSATRWSTDRPCPLATSTCWAVTPSASTQPDRLRSATSI